MCGSSGSATSTTKFEAPGFTQPGWQDLISGAQNLTSQPYQQYQGMQMAPQNGQQIEAQNFIQDRALNGAPDLNAGRGAATAVANGQYFNNSPWTDPSYVNNVIGQNANTMANSAAIGQNAQDDAAFARSGAYGGSAWQQKQAQNSFALNNSIGQMANNYQLQNAQMGNQNYQQGVGQMLQAGQLGGQLSQDDWTAGQNLTNIGNQNQQYTQGLLSNSQQNFQQGQQFPYQQLQTMLQMLSGASGNYGQTTANPYGGSGSTLTGLLGGAALGGGLIL
jgi:hypothetical protein